MSVRSRHLLAGAGALIASVVTLSGCAQKTASGDGTITVKASDSTCEVSRTEFPAGHLTLDVQNTGSKVTEVYVLFPDDRIAAERENIGPGTKASITAEIKAGDYEIACKPGMKGDGIRRKVTATGRNAAVKRSPEADAAVAAYRSYVLEQARETLPKAQAFADAVKAGDLETAKKLYAPSRIGWERTEPVAESLGDINP
ncbi:cupredoxin domain-containing protein, partial [Streptomyces sp. NPDC059456]|uniref:cupredoxin domain-containing protein n=1 Tax=Streptomyces sp. NPDC059456 TaxID=3346838 RepID=UPI003675A267